MSAPPRPSLAPPDIAKISSPAPGVSVSGQFSATDVPKLSASGIRHVIDLTQPQETPGFDERTALAGANIAYDRLPIGGAADLTPARVRDFDRLVSAAERPLLVHCASANRVGALAALRAAWIQGKDPDEALRIGRAWGLKGLEPAVREKLAHGGR